MNSVEKKPCTRATSKLGSFVFLKPFFAAPARISAEVGLIEMRAFGLLLFVACAQSSVLSNSPSARLRGGEGGGDAAPVMKAVASRLVTAVPTTPFEGQKPGTSGLRKKTAVFMQPGYLENFIQSLFDSLPADELRGATLVVSGDGRYHNSAAIQTICRMAAARGVARVWVGRDGLLSTPAASCVIREREGGVACGGILLTASHNPGGPDADFGIKYNVRNGGPALESLTGAVHQRSTEVSEYAICAGLPDVDLSREGRYLFCESAGVAPFFEVQVIDPAEDYVNLMSSLFDFEALRALLARPDMSFVFDGMHGVAGPYAHAVFGALLGKKCDNGLNLPDRNQDLGRSRAVCGNGWKRSGRGPCQCGRSS